jgi:hypothetical protein
LNIWTKNPCVNKIRCFQPCPVQFPPTVPFLFWLHHFSPF